MNTWKFVYRLMCSWIGASAAISSGRSKFRPVLFGTKIASLMLAIDPDVVRLELAEAGNTAPLAELIEPMRTGGVAAVSANGVLGDPAGASPDAGARLLEALVADLVDHIAALAV